jgi:hypothetical protein
MSFAGAFMLRTRQINRYAAAGLYARGCVTSRALTATELLSPLPRPQRVSRQLQLSCSGRLTTFVAKNAFRDKTRLTTEFATRQNSPHTYRLYPCSRHSVATKRIPAQRPSHSLPTPSGQSASFCRQNCAPRQNSLEVLTSPPLAVLPRRQPFAESPAARGRAR